MKRKANRPHFINITCNVDSADEINKGREVCASIPNNLKCQKVRFAEQFHFFLHKMHPWKQRFVS